MAICVIYQNVRGLRAKLQQFKRNVSINNHDIICISETWLNSNIFDFEIIDSHEYSIFRPDRCTSKSEKKDGDGTMIAIKNHLNPIPVPELQSVYLSPGDSIAPLILPPN